MGFYFDGKYFPLSIESVSFGWGERCMCREPVKCILLSATERGKKNARRDRFEPGSHSRIADELLQSSASGLPSTLSWSEKIEKQTPPKLPFASQWKDRFVLIGDGDKGFYFDGKYFPLSCESEFFVWEGSMCLEPVKCLLLSTTERGADDAYGIVFKPDSLERANRPTRDEDDFAKPDWRLQLVDGVCLGREFDH